MGALASRLVVAMAAVCPVRFTVLGEITAGVTTEVAAYTVFGLRVAVPTL